MISVVGIARPDNVEGGAADCGRTFIAHLNKCFIYLEFLTNNALNRLNSEKKDKSNLKDVSHHRADLKVEHRRGSLRSIPDRIVDLFRLRLSRQIKLRFCLDWDFPGERVVRLLSWQLRNRGVDAHPNFDVIV